MPDVDVRGCVADGFEPVRDAFEAVLKTEGIAFDAQVAVYHRGELVVDLWADARGANGSLLGIYSASKGVTHLLVASLVQDGVLDLDEKVSHYWSQFAANGKRGITLRQLLSHQAGLVGTDEGFSLEELADDRLVAERLAEQRPYWRPGAASGYHALVMGALSGEVVRRVTGQSVPSLFGSRLREPHGLDLHLGLAPDDDHRFLPAQPMIETPERLRDLAAAATDPRSLSGIAFNRQHADSPQVWELPNHDVIRAKGPASFGGVGTARSLAKLYAAVIHPLDGQPPLLTPDVARQFAQIQSAGWDLVLRQHKSWAVGFHPVAELYPVLGANAFGHSGAGGQQALVDPSHDFSYAFLRRRFLLPQQADADHGRILRAVRAGIDGGGEHG